MFLLWRVFLLEGSFTSGCTHSTCRFLFPFFFGGHKLQGVQLEGRLIPHVIDVGNTIHGPVAHVCVWWVIDEVPFHVGHMRIKKDGCLQISS